MSSYQVIARKYRPRAFDGVVGQEAIARTLRNAIERGRVAHAYMFCGPRGVGKTSMARIFARALNCLSSDGATTEPCGTCDLCERVWKGDDLDVLEIDAASNRRVDDARTLISSVSFHPTRARFKVYIVDEVHMLTTEAFNALLKTLEEPPPHVKFVFATTDPQKVPATILSRCQRFDFRPIPTTDLVRLLTGICERESLRAEPEAIQAIARASLGGARDAESLLEQLATLGSGEVRLEDLHSLLGTVPAERMRAIFEAVASGDVGRTLGEATRVLDQGTDPGELMRQCMRHAHDLMLVRAQGARAADVEADEAGRSALAEQAAKFGDATLVYAVTVFSEALRNARQLGEGRLFAETALARLAGHRDMRFMDQLVRELQALEKRVGQPSAIPEPPPLAHLVAGDGRGGAASPAVADSVAPVGLGRAQVAPANSPDRSGSVRGSATGTPGAAGGSAGTSAPGGADGAAVRADSPGAGSTSSPPTRASPARAAASAAVAASLAATADEAAAAGARVRLGSTAAAQVGESPEPAPPWDAAEAAVPIPPTGDDDPWADPASRDARPAIGGGGRVGAADPGRGPDSRTSPVAVPMAPAEGYDSGSSAASADSGWGGPADAARTSVGAEPPVPPGAPGPDLETVRARWSDIRDRAAQGSAMFRASLQMAEVEEVRDGRVVLAFGESARVHRAKVDEPAARARIEAALGTFFGPGLRVDTIVRPESAAAPADSEPRRTAEPSQRLTSAEQEAVRASPVTRLVEQELGGVIVNTQREE